MSHPKQDEIDHAFATALELPDEELSVWLAQQPDAVREEVESLLAAWRRSEDFLGDETGGQTAGPDFTGRMQAVLARVAAARGSQSGQHGAQLPGSGERTGLTPLNNGTRIGPYQIEGVLGRGGM